MTFVADLLEATLIKTPVLSLALLLEELEASLSFTKTLRLESVLAGMESERCQDDLPPIEALLGGGVSGVIYALDDDTVLKTATGLYTSVQDLEVERRIYERLGSHPCILRCIRVESRGLVLERLVYPLRKRLRDLHRKGVVPSDEYMRKWAGQIVDGLGYIHSKGVLQADIGCHNLLLDKNDDLKLCDFGGASIDGEKATVCYERRSQHPNIQGPDVTTEIFALGTTLYEMSTAEPPYSKINSATGEIQRLYAAREFPDVEHLMLGKIIQKCWRGSYDSTADVAFDLRQVRQGLGIACAHHADCLAHAVYSGPPLIKGFGPYKTFMASAFSVFTSNITQLSSSHTSSLACYTDTFDMYLPCLTTLIIYLIALASASPIAWPDDKLEEINALRAKGVSEAEIAARNPQPLTSPSPVPLSESVSFFGHSIMGTADVSSDPLKKRSFRESVGRRGEEIAKIL